MLNTFWTHSLWALQFLGAEQLRWISCGILIFLGIAGIATLFSSSTRSKPRGFYVSPLLLLVGFPLTIAIGVVFQAPSPSSPSRLGYWLLNAVDVIAVAFAIFCVYRAEGIRWFTAAVVITALWLIVVAGFVAGMSVSGDWI